MGYETAARRVLDSGDGLAHRRDLVAAGVHRNWIAREIKAGRLFQPLPGVLSRRDDAWDLMPRLRAALLFAGRDAALAHRTALAAWQLTRPPGPGEAIHVAVPHGTLPRVPRSADLIVHQRLRGPAAYRSGLPVVPVPEALRALAVDSPISEVRLLAFDALSSRMVLPADLIEGASRRVSAVMRLIVEEAHAGALSGGEATYWRLIKDAGLPLPELNAWCPTPEGGYMVDALWRRLLLAAEIDGRSVHAQEHAFEADRERQNRLHISGLVLIRFPVSMVLNQGPRVVRDTRDALRSRADQLGVPWR